MSQQTMTSTSAHLTSPWVVLPTYNERDNAEKMVRALFSQGIPNLTVLVVDDSSPDGTADAVKRLQPEFPHLKLLVRKTKDGLGRAYIAGFKHALENGATAILQMDADFSHDPADTIRLFAALSNSDVVLGSRYSNGISVVNWPLKRLLISMGGNIYAQIVTGLPFKDSTGGFKSWRAETLRDIKFETIAADGYSFQIAATYRAWRRRHKIVEIPIIFTERRQGESKMSKAIVWEAIWLVWKLRFGKQ